MTNKIANKYRANYSEEFEDIKQLALIGLWKAVTRYNGKNALSTFAYVVIQNEINLYLRKIKKISQDYFNKRGSRRQFDTRRYVTSRRWC